MARRPSLSAESFLNAIFRPSKNPLPKGLRKRSLKGSKQQSKRRVAAYNKMDAAKQAIIDRSGNREAYLRGDITYADSKRALRQQGVERGIIPPVRSRGGSISAEDVARRYISVLHSAGASPNVPKTIERILDMTDAELRKAWTATYDTIKQNAQRTVPPGEVNPWWYL